MTLSNPAQYISGRTVQEQMNSLIDYVDQRAADVALDAIASDVAQVHQDMLDADADANAAAASAAAAAGTLANAVKKTGEASQSIAGDIIVSGDLTGGSITVPTPVNNTDAASKKYVDDANALNVQLAGAQAIAGAKTVPLEATGTFSNQIASSNKVENELDNYTPMVRTTGNQDISGVKTFMSRPLKVNMLGSGGESDVSIQISDNRHDPDHTIGTNPSSITLGKIGFFDGSGNWGGTLMISITNEGVAQLIAQLRTSNGTVRSVTLASGGTI